MSTSRILSFIFFLLLLTPVFGQFSPFDKYENPLPYIVPVNKSTAICDNDTLMYPLSKATAIEWQQMNISVFYAQIGQRYETPQTVTVHGACFYAKTDLTASGPANFDVLMYSVNGVGLPDTIMATTSASAPLLPGTPAENTRNCVSFSTPVTTSEEYYIVIDGRGTTLPLSFARNSDSFDDGDSEGLSAVYYDDGSGGAIVNWYDQRFDPAFTPPSDPLGWNYDYLLDPIVSYDLVLNATISGPDTSCSAATICVETDSVSPIFSHRMYTTNPNVMRETNWGDGTTSVGDSSCHYYPLAGQFYISHSMVMNGWNIICVAEEIDSIFVANEPSANFSYAISEDTVEFTNTSSIVTGTLSSVWDFGSAGSSSAFDVTVVFPSNGSYDVQLIVTSLSGCSDTITQTIFITVGMEEQETLHLSMYPNPSKGLLFIDNIAHKEPINITIMEMTGKLVHTDRLGIGQNKIVLDHLSPGHYVVKFSTAEAMRMEQLFIVK